MRRSPWFKRCSTFYKKSHWNLYHCVWNWCLFTCSFKMAVAPKPNEILGSMNGRDNFSSCSSTALKLWVTKNILWNERLQKENQIMSVCLLPAKSSIKLRSFSCFYFVLLLTDSGVCLCLAIVLVAFSIRNMLWAFELYVTNNRTFVLLFC